MPVSNKTTPLPAATAQALPCGTPGQGSGRRSRQTPGGTRAARASSRLRAGFATAALFAGGVLSGTGDRDGNRQEDRGGGPVVRAAGVPGPGRLRAGPGRRGPALHRPVRVGHRRHRAGADLHPPRARQPARRQGLEDPVDRAARPALHHGRAALLADLHRAGEAAAAGTDGGRARRRLVRRSLGPGAIPLVGRAALDRLGHRSAGRKLTARYAPRVGVEEVLWVLVFVWFGIHISFPRTSQVSRFAGVVLGTTFLEVIVWFATHEGALP